jgi:Arc/MetJ-type ribon-helix-helix transcriptional regulator
MNSAKITISLNRELLSRLDLLVQSRVYSSRSQAIQAAVQEKVARLQKARLAVQCASLDPAEEQALAEMGLAADGDQWPEY